MFNVLLQRLEKMQEEMEEVKSELLSCIQESFDLEALNLEIINEEEDEDEDDAEGDEAEESEGDDEEESEESEDEDLDLDDEGEGEGDDEAEGEDLDLGDDEGGEEEAPEDEGGDEGEVVDADGELEDQEAKDDDVDAIENEKDEDEPADLEDLEETFPQEGVFTELGIGDKFSFSDQGTDDEYTKVSPREYETDDGDVRAVKNPDSPVVKIEIDVEGGEVEVDDGEDEEGVMSDEPVDSDVEGELAESTIAKRINKLVSEAMDDEEGKEEDDKKGKDKKDK